MEVLIGTLGRSESEESGFGHAYGIWLYNQLDITGFLYCLELVGRLTS